MIPGYGMGNSLELNLQDMTGGELATFYEAAIQFLGALNERPEVAMAYNRMLSTSRRYRWKWTLPMQACGNFAECGARCGGQLLRWRVYLQL